MTKMVTPGSGRILEVTTVDGPLMIGIPRGSRYRITDRGDGTQWLTVRKWWGRTMIHMPILPNAHPDDVGPIGGRGDTWGVHWGYARFPEGIPWNSAGALSQGRAYRRALDSLERFGDPSDLVAVRIGPLASRGSGLHGSGLLGGPGLAEVVHETTGTLAEVRAQVTRWRDDYRTGAAR